MGQILRGLRDNLNPADVNKTIRDRWQFSWIKCLWDHGTVCFNPENATGRYTICNILKISQGKNTLAYYSCSSATRTNSLETLKSVDRRIENDLQSVTDDLGTWSVSKVTNDEPSSGENNNQLPPVNYFILRKKNIFDNVDFLSNTFHILVCENIVKVLLLYKRSLLCFINLAQANDLWLYLLSRSLYYKKIYGSNCCRIAIS